MSRLAFRVGAAYWGRSARGQREDYIRVIEDPEATLAVVANASDNPTRMVSPVLSRLMLDLMTRAWRSAKGNARERLEYAVEWVRERFGTASMDLGDSNNSIAPSAGIKIVDSGAVSSSSTSAGWMAAVAVDSAGTHGVWIGGEGLLLVRAFRVAAQSRPHTLANRQIDLGKLSPDSAGTLPGGRALVRGFGSRYEREASTAQYFDSWESRPQDQIALVSESVLSQVPEGDLGVLATSTPSPQAAAESIVGAVAERSKRPYAAVVLIRVESSPGLDVRIRELIKHPPATTGADEGGDERAEATRELELFARKAQLLPVNTAQDNMLCLRADGAPVQVDTQAEPAAVKPLRSPIGRQICCVQAAAKYPELKEIIPPRPLGATDCNECKAFAPDPCGICAGLGWKLPLLAGQKAPVPASTAARKSGTKTTRSSGSHSSGLGAGGILFSLVVLAAVLWLLFGRG